MKSFLSIVTFAFSFSLIAQTGEWEVAKEKDDIVVYLRKVEGFALKEFRGVAEINASVEKLVAQLKDADKMKDWLPDCSKSELLEWKDPVQIHYTITDAPWPVTDRDGYFKFEYTRISNGVKVLASCLPNYKAEKEGLVRIPMTQGFWQFEKINDQRTRVTYQMLVSPGGSIPDWLANSGVVNTPFDTLKNLRARVE